MQKYTSIRYEARQLIGSLCNQSVIPDNRIARWFDAPEPPEIPDKCFLEMQKARMAHEV